MKTLVWAFAAALVTSLMTPFAQGAELLVDRPVVVNDTIPNAMLPMGLVRAGETDLLAAFCDGADIMPGSKAYLIRSKDLGETWEPEPETVFTPDAPHIGLAAGLASLPDGRILLIKTVETYHTDDRTWEAVFKSHTPAFELAVSSDGGKTFQPAGNLPVAEGAVGGVQGVVVALANGDLILPGFQYPGSNGELEGAAYGSGFFRSTDGGRTWGPLEVAFRDPVPGRAKKLLFNEPAFAVRPDGSVTGFARVDSEHSEESEDRWVAKGNHLWRVESRDHGKTWSVPEETSIGGIFPAIVRLPNGPYVLACGNRHESPTRKVCLYTSDDAWNFQFAGYAPYLRTHGECVSSATGGSQCLLPLGDKEAYCIYYAADPELLSEHRTYIEGFLIRAGE